MKLFLVEKRDLLGNDDARYIVQATTQDEATQKVNLSPDDVRLFQIGSLNGEESFSRFIIIVEEIEFNQEGFYLQA